MGGADGGLGPDSRKVGTRDSGGALAGVGSRDGCADDADGSCPINELFDGIRDSVPGAEAVAAAAAAAAAICMLSGRKSGASPALMMVEPCIASEDE